jgi:hypothetical protein
MTSSRLFVFDTITLVSAAILENSTPQRALRRALEIGTIALSRETLAELTEVLSRDKFNRYASVDERDEFLEVVVLRSVWVDVAANISASRDPDDDKFLELAVEAQVDAIVSGDQDLLVLHPFRGIPILTPTDFLSLSDRWSAGET